MRSHWFVAFSCLCLLTACDRKVSHTETYAEREGAFGKEATSSHSYSFESEDPLKGGRALVGERQFDQAIAVFQHVYQSNVDRAVRAEALFEWARAEATLFNAKRDVGLPPK